MKKLNWGVGLVIGMSLFIVFILYFVLRITFEDQYSLDLVAEQYFEKELEFQKEIDAEQNAKTYNYNLTAHKSSRGYLLSFPEDLDVGQITGNIFFYRPSDKSFDFQETLKMSGNKFLIPGDKLDDGRWDIKVLWQYQGKDFLFKDRIIY